jgi:Holliday junction DNA helicase RuvB
MFNKFIGQTKIKLELESISQQINNKFEGINILLRGQAGCGKTLLAKSFLSSLGDYTSQLPSKISNYELIWDERIFKYKFHFIDEIHSLKHIEVLYPIMDSKEHIFTYASNEYGELPEALLSRCFVYSFCDYTAKEISSIVFEYAKTRNIYLENTLADLFAKYSRNNPRMVKNLFDRVLFIIHRGYYNLNSRGIISALNDIGIYDGGYTDLDMKYLETLHNASSLSLDTISRLLKVDKNTIVNEIEPFLIDKGHMIISPRGRKFIKW